MFSKTQNCNQKRQSPRKGCLGQIRAEGPQMASKCPSPRMAHGDCQLDETQNPGTLVSGYFCEGAQQLG